MKPDLALLDLSTWTPIARLAGPRRGWIRWEAMDGAPLTAAEARALVDAGRLLMAQRRVDGRCELVVKARAKPPISLLRKAKRAA